MNPRLLSAILATTALAGATLTPAPLRADETLRLQPSGTERWRLRPAEVTATGTIVPVTKNRPTSDIAAERRSVRVVYPGLLADR